MDNASILTSLGLGLLGLIAGSLSGLLGIGGAVVIIPALVLVFGYGQRTAQGTTLLLMIPPIGLLAALQYWKAGDVNLKAAVIIAAFFFVGGLLGGKLATSLDPTLIRRIFAVFLIGIAIKMLID
jgi:uncharacterized membrane protein YfcA